MQVHRTSHVPPQAQEAAAPSPESSEKERGGERERGREGERERGREGERESVPRCSSNLSMEQHLSCCDFGTEAVTREAEEESKPRQRSQPNKKGKKGNLEVVTPKTKSKQKDRLVSRGNAQVWTSRGVGYDRKGEKRRRSHDCQNEEREEEHTTLEVNACSAQH